MRRGGGKKPAGAPQANGGDASGAAGGAAAPAAAGDSGSKPARSPRARRAPRAAPGIGERPIGEQPRPGSGRSVLRDPVAELTDALVSTRWGERGLRARGLLVHVSRRGVLVDHGSFGIGQVDAPEPAGCIDRPTRGSYRIRGQEVATLSDDELSEMRSRTLGFVFQSYNLIRSSTCSRTSSSALLSGRPPRGR